MVNQATRSALRGSALAGSTQGPAGLPPAAGLPPGPPKCGRRTSSALARPKAAYKCLTIVDTATTEAVAVVPARSLDGLPVTRGPESLAPTPGLPQVLRADKREKTGLVGLTLAAYARQWTATSKRRQ